MGKSRGSSLAAAMTRQFIRFTKEYQEGLEESGNSSASKWDPDAIIAYARHIDQSLKRKPDKSLLFFCESAIDSLRALECDSDGSDEQLSVEEVEMHNSMNLSIRGIYQHSEESIGTLVSGKNAAGSSATASPAPPIRDAGTPKRKNASHNMEAKKPKLLAGDVPTQDLKWPTPSTRLSDLGGIDAIADVLVSSFRTYCSLSACHFDIQKSISI